MVSKVEPILNSACFSNIKGIGVAISFAMYSVLPFYIEAFKYAIAS